MNSVAVAITITLLVVCCYLVIIAETKGNWHYRCRTCDLYTVINLDHAMP